ncbi:hypothetical protein ACEPAG_6684 [Sanghuangporus baumii]
MYRAVSVPSRFTRTLVYSTRSYYIRPSLPSRYAFAISTTLQNRSIATASSAQEPLTSTRIEESAVKGTEGPHYADTTGAVTTKAPVDDSYIQGIGDWVLYRPVYTAEELKAVQSTVHRREVTLSDKMASGLVRLARKMFDLVSGYKHKPLPLGTNMTVEELRKEGYVMTEVGWMNRCMFLETIAGIPGMVAATVRHLHSLRLLRRDAGWIHTLLEEAENERMHLMSFLAIKKPGIFMRALILGAQGVFYNLFFLSYLVSPRVCHRFVGYLEEEAVKTYTALISDLENGRFPEWADQPAPEIAKDYWRLPDDAKRLDMIYAIRSDEVSHRFVNHSLANLKMNDVNPFAFREPDMTVKGIKYGFERDEAAQYVRESLEIVKENSSEESARSTKDT